MNTSVSNKTNFALDLTIFGAFLAVSNPRLTGNSIHEWLGISFAAAIITHLLFHWKWLVQISSGFFKKLFHQSRLNFVVDLLFFIAMTGVIFSGILISKDVLAFLGIQFNARENWKMIHSLTADLSLITLGIHTALHWRWITGMLNRTIAEPVLSLFSAKAPEREQNAPQNMVVIPVRIKDQK